jgi:hypothetical protein
MSCLLVNNHLSATSDGVLEGFALQILHGHEAPSSLFANFVNGADVGMVESGSSTSLPAEAFKGLRVFGEIFGKEFQSDETPKLNVLSLKDNTHGAATKLFYDTVVRDGLTD